MATWRRKTRRLGCDEALTKLEVLCYLRGHDDGRRDGLRDGERRGARLPTADTLALLSEGLTEDTAEVVLDSIRAWRGGR